MKSLQKATMFNFYPDLGGFGGPPPPPPPEDDDFDDLSGLADFGPPSEQSHQNQPMTPLEADLDPEFMPPGAGGFNQGFAPPPLPPENDDQDFDYNDPQLPVNELDGFDSPIENTPPQMPQEYPHIPQYAPPQPSGVDPGWQQIPQNPGQSDFNSPDYGSYPPPHEEYDLPSQEEYPPTTGEVPYTDQGYQPQDPPPESYPQQQEFAPDNYQGQENLPPVSLSNVPEKQQLDELPPTPESNYQPETGSDNLADFAFPTTPSIDPESISANGSGYSSEPQEQDDSQIPTMPEPISDPSANQLSVGANQPYQEEEEESLMGEFSIQKGLEKMLQSGLPNTGLAEREETFEKAPTPPSIPQVAQGELEYTEQHKEAEGGKTPRFFTDIPTFQEAPGVYGRRVASFIWILLSGLLAIAFFLLTNGEEVRIASVLIGPMTLTGIFLLTGARWSGWLGIFASSLYAILFLSIPIVVNALNTPLEINGVSMMPPEVALSYLVSGICFLAGSLILLLKDPGRKRAIVGTTLIVLPLSLSSTWLVIASKSLQGNLNINEKDFTSQTISDEKNGIRFLKPDGWATPNWDLFKEASPLAFGLVQKPTNFYLNRNQDMMVAIYWDALPKIDLSTLLKGDQASDLEKEIIRNMTLNEELADTFPFKGHNFSENVYIGNVSKGVDLQVIMDKARLSDRVLLITVTQDTNSRFSKEKDAFEILNPYFQDLVITRP